MITTARLTAVTAVLCMAWVFAGPVNANPKIAKDTGKPCATCHTATGKPDLNDLGKCFKEKKDLAACAKK